MATERARPHAPPFIDPPGYARHRPEATLLYQIIELRYPELVAVREAAGRPLPGYVQQEFEAYLKCGRLEHGFLRVRCEDCHAEKLVAFSCKRRGFCPSCGARRMTDSAALLADEVLPAKPIRQWVLSLPFALRFLLATDAQALTQVLGIVYRTIAALPSHRCSGELSPHVRGSCKRSSSGWPSASVAHSNAKASSPAMPKTAISSSIPMPAACSMI
jgi:ribosomal protein S27E